MPCPDVAILFHTHVIGFPILWPTGLWAVYHQRIKLCKVFNANINLCQVIQINIEENGRQDRSLPHPTGDHKHFGVIIFPFNTSWTISKQTHNDIKQLDREKSFHKFSKKSMMVDFIESFWQIDRTNVLSICQKLSIKSTM